MILKDDPKWKTNSPLQRFSKKIRTTESGAYTSSSNVDASLDIDDNETEVCPIGQKQAKKGKRKGKSKMNEENNNDELQAFRNMVEAKYDKKLKL